MAYVLGLAPGRATEVPIVIVAEDGVTSLRYFLNIFRTAAPKNSSGSDGPWGLGSNASLGKAAGPSSSLGIVRGGSSGGEEKESRLGDLAASARSTKAARQPGDEPSLSPLCAAKGSLPIVNRMKVRVR